MEAHVNDDTTVSECTITGTNKQVNVSKRITGNYIRNTITCKIGSGYSPSTSTPIDISRKTSSKAGCKTALALKETTDKQVHTAPSKRDLYMMMPLYNLLLTIASCLNYYC
jgi:hypothetical protein